MVADNVKSVTRVFQVLECFEEERRPLTATTVARALSYPQSSTQAVLKTMVNVGYLTYDSRIRAYFPTPKVLLKTSWLRDSNSILLDAMEDLRDMTGETVTLCSYRNTDMQIVQLVQGKHPISLTLQPGDRIDLFTSTVGHAFLADQTDELVERLIKRRQKLAARKQARAIKPSEVRKAVEAVRSRGVAVGYGLVLSGVGAIAAAIRCPVSGASYVLCVGGPEARLAAQENQIVDALHHVVDSRGYPPHGFLESTVRPGLERITRRFEAFFEDELRDVGISAKESQVIGLLLARGPLDAKQLVTLGLVAGSSLDKTLESLSTKRLITKDTAHYSLTARGRKLASSLSEKLRSYRVNALGHIDAAEAQELQRTLDRLSEWIRSAAPANPQ